MPGWESPKEDIPQEADFDLPSYSVEGEGNPFVDKLKIDFESLLRERDSLRESIPKDFRKKTRDFINSLYLNVFREGEDYVDERCAPIVAAIAKRIKAETTIQKELEGIIDIEGITDLQEFLDQHKVKATVWMGKYTAGGYDPEFGGITIRKDTYIPNKADTLYSLANGGFPDLFSTVTHELIHAEQSPTDKTETLTRVAANFTTMAYALSAVVMATWAGIAGKDETLMYPVLLSSLAALVARYRPNQWNDLSALHEAQAHKLPTTEYIQPNLALLETLRWEYGQKSSKQIDKCLSAMIDVDRLLALGYNHNKIAQLCQKAEWDTETHAYDTLHKTIEMIKEVRGLSDEQVDSLIDARRLKQQINRLKVQKIALEEMGLMTPGK